MAEVQTTTVQPLSLGYGHDEVFTPLPTYTLMEQKRAVCRDLMEGVDALRDRGTAYLPKKEMETDTVYNNRLNSATLFNAFKRAVSNLVGRVFSKAVDVINGPDAHASWYENIDLQGNNIDMFAKDVFSTALSEGVSFILVDFPNAPAAETMGEEKAQASIRRPYWVHIKPQEVIGWRFSYIGGVPILQHVRIRQYIEVPDGKYGVKLIERVRIYSPGKCEEYSRNNQEDRPEVFYQEYQMGIKDHVPLVPIYTDRKAAMVAYPALYDMAVLNVRWYQSNSTQDHILDYARFPVLFGKKIFQAQDDNKVPFGPGSMIHSLDDGADLKYVEHMGHAIQAGDNSLAKLEDRMALLAFDPLMTKRSGNETATRTAIDSASASSSLQAWALQLKDGLEQCLYFTALWSSTPPENIGTLQINTDYALSISKEDYNALRQLRNDGELSRQTLWGELSRRGFLGPDFNYEEELERLQEEGAVKDNGDGLLSKMVDKQILPKELLFLELKRRGSIDPELEWAEVQVMLQRENVGPEVGFAATNTLDQMLGVAGQNE